MIKIANRTREIGLSGMKRGVCGNNDSDPKGLIFTIPADIPDVIVDYHRSG